MLIFWQFSGTFKTRFNQENHVDRYHVMRALQQKLLFSEEI